MVAVATVTSSNPGPPPRGCLCTRLRWALAIAVAATRAKLRDSLAVQNERLDKALESLERAGRLTTSGLTVFFSRKWSDPPAELYGPAI
jgi:hypothetical protein